MYAAKTENAKNFNNANAIRNFGLANSIIHVYEHIRSAAKS